MACRMRVWHAAALEQLSVDAAGGAGRRVGVTRRGLGKGRTSTHYLLLTTYDLLPTTYYLLPTAYYLLLTAYETYTSDD